MKVNTLIIGAGRSGTTSLFKILEDHPEVCFSTIKEVHYFSIEDLNQRGEDYYHSFFPNYNQEPVVASADTYLMIDYKVIKRIKAYNPEMKIIVMLRNPVDRAYSSYNYSVNYGYHEAYPSFTDSVEIEKKLKDEPSIVQQNNIGHFYAGLYAKHLKEWFKGFPSDQFLILKTDELKSEQAGIKQKLSNFLGIQPFNAENSDKEKQNANAIPKFRRFEQFLLNRENPVRRFIRWIFPSFIKRMIINSGVVDKMHDLNRTSAEYKPLDPDTRQKAMAWFKDDLELLKNDFGIEL